MIGDLIIDHFIWGSVSRISPEAPVPVVNVTRENLLLGGAANVLHNIYALGGKGEMCGVVGQDIMGDHLLELLQALGSPTAGIVRSQDRPTTKKTRIIAQHQQVVRFDREKTGPFPAGVRRSSIRLSGKEPATFQAVVISDYDKGMISERTDGRAACRSCRVANEHPGDRRSQTPAAGTLRRGHDHDPQPARGRDDGRDHHHQRRGTLRGGRADLAEAGLQRPADHPGRGGHGPVREGSRAAADPDHGPGGLRRHRCRRYGGRDPGPGAGRRPRFHRGGRPGQPRRRHRGGQTGHGHGHPRPRSRENLHEQDPQHDRLRPGRTESATAEPGRWKSVRSITGSAISRSGCPASIAALEEPIKKEIAAAYSRGHVEVAVNCSGGEEGEYRLRSRSAPGPPVLPLPA